MSVSTIEEKTRTATGGGRFVDVADETARVRGYLEAGDPVVLVGPTGCGKTTLVEELVGESGRVLMTVIANPDMTVRHLLGGYVIEGNASKWLDGPVTRAVKEGMVLYLDEADLLPRECLAPIFSLVDHRRELFVSEMTTSYKAAAGFRFVASYNPDGGLAGGLPPAFRQRCRFVRFGYLPPEKEVQLLVERTGIGEADAEFLVNIAEITRQTGDGMAPGASTRLLLLASRSLLAGLSRATVVQDTILGPISDSPAVQWRLLTAMKSAGMMQLKGFEHLRAQASDDEAPVDLGDDDFFETADVENG